MSDATRHRGRDAWLGALALGVYVAGALLHSHFVNIDPARHDQDAYLRFSRWLRLSGFTEPTNRSQMPAFLYFQALVVDPAADLAAQFARAKLASIALSVVLMGALSAFFARALPRREAWAAILATAFTVFVFRAAYVQAELLFYTLSFFGFAALVRLWVRPSFGVAALAGLLEAGAFLAKGSVQPGIALFTALFAGRALVRRDSPGRRLAQAALFLFAFVAPLAPYLKTSHDHYGSWFFNVNTRYVLWTDSWDDFRALEGRLGGWWTWWPRLPEGDLPSMAHYLASHSVLAILEREVLGVGEVLGNLVLGTGYFEFLVLLLGFTALARGFFRAPLNALRSIDAASPAAFVLPYALLYTALFGFYAPIAAGPRFILMLFLPLLYTVLRWGSETEPTASLAGRTWAWRDFVTFLLILLVLHVGFVLPATIGRIYAGG
ncbi:MAG TPA: hypothetical protein VGI39_38680 [Polyangiaceae bacterium]